MRRPNNDRPITSRERLVVAFLLCVLALLALTAQGCAAPPATAADARWGIITPSERTVQLDESAVYVMNQQLKIMSQMEADYPNIDAHVVWRPCGSENGSYRFFDHEITICAEDLEHPTWAMQVMAHEFGHAIATQRLDLADEYAADELAIVAMGRHGWFTEMVGAAMYMQQNWKPEHIEGDDHPPGKFRAWEMLCAETGAESLANGDRGFNPDPDCTALWRGLLLKWDTLIPPGSAPSE